MNIIITAKVVRKFCFLSILLLTYVVVWAARPQQVQVPIDKQEKYFNYLVNQNQVHISHLEGINS